MELVDFKLLVENYSGLSVKSVIPYYKSGLVKITEQIPSTSNQGCLYNYKALTHNPSMFAAGWDCPTKVQFDVLIAAYGLNAGGKMKSLSGWNSPNTGATDELGMNAKPTGYRDLANGVYYQAGTVSKWWCLYDQGGPFVAPIQLFHNQSALTIGYAGAVSTNGNTGMAVRAVKLVTALAEGQRGSYVGNDGRKYETVCICGMEFTASNLAETKYRDGSVIPNVPIAADWMTLVNDGLCYYDNIIANGVNAASVVLRSLTDLGFDSKCFHGGNLRINAGSLVQKKMGAPDNTDIRDYQTLIKLTTYLNELNVSRVDCDNAANINDEKSTVNVFLNYSTMQNEKLYYVNQYLQDIVFKQIGIDLQFKKLEFNPTECLTDDSISYQFSGFKAIF